MPSVKLLDDGSDILMREECQRAGGHQRIAMAFQRVDEPKDDEECMTTRVEGRHFHFSL